MMSNIHQVRGVRDVSHVTIQGGPGAQGGSGNETGGAGGAGGSPVVNIIKGSNEDLFKWLGNPPDTQDRQYQLQGLRHEDTGTWLLQDNQLISWKNTPGILWIRGISGTGKSVLSSTIIRDLVDTGNTVAYFFFDFRIPDRQSLDIMLRSIVWQLSGKSDTPYDSLSNLHKGLGKGTIQPQRKDLHKVLDDLIVELEQICIVLDGLDECHRDDWAGLVEFVNRRHGSSIKCHVLFTSQPHQEFQTGFHGIPLIQLHGSILDEDIRSLVYSKILTMSKDSEHARTFTEKIVKQSDGM
ncbi:hypothetical protein FB45DRAFT_464541 [Roridomyces roridus]|uniref:Nephrocystin 3-like N-terminal domain-containing protein n=1 Tax=Roridomyces roridus TaxID=1738132 RepID=A0AAD7AZN5_9AGAR|nr:hypothetical protein FB45DRAFT_464541 [Roridomyces roridus]